MDDQIQPNLNDPSLPPDAPADPLTSPIVLLPPRPPHPNFWWSLLWCAGFLVMQVGVQIAATVVAVVVMLIVDPNFARNLKDAAGRGGKAVEALLGPEVLGFGMFCQELTAVFFALVALRLVVGSQWRRHIALVPPRAIHVVLALLTMPGMLVIENLVHYYAQRWLPGFQYQEIVEKTIRMFPVGFALTVFSLGPGVAEELLFRGFIGRGLVARRGLAVGVLLTSFLFGLMHLDPPHVVATMVMGAVLHYVYLTGRSIVLPMLMHMLNNGMAVLAVKQVPPFDTIEEPNGWAMVPAVVLLIAAGWALYDSRARVVPDTAEGWQPAFPGVEYPPAGASARVRRHRPGWLSGLAVISALAALVVTIWLT
jgi:membrane protease YdiL (CAAX protease family)